MHAEVFNTLPLTERDKGLLHSAIHAVLYSVAPAYLHETYGNPNHPASLFDMDVIARRMLSVLNNSLGSLQAAHASVEVCFTHTGSKSFLVDMGYLIDPATNQVRYEVVYPLFTFNFAIKLLASAGTAIQITLIEGGQVQIKLQEVCE